MILDRLFPKRAALRRALAKTLEAKHKLAATFVEMARHNEFRLVSKESIESEIGVDNVNGWDSDDDDMWYCIVNPSDDEFPELKASHKYEIHGSGKTALEALANYIYIANLKDGDLPSQRIPAEVAENCPEHHLLFAIFADGKYSDTEKSKIKKWLKEVDSK